MQEVNLGLYFLSELVGTAMLLLLGGGVVANVILAKSKGLGGGTLMINWGWGLAVFAGVLVSAYSGAQLNPAVSLGLLIAGKISGVQFLVAVSAQLVGAFIGAVLFADVATPADKGASRSEARALLARLLRQVLGHVSPTARLVVNTKEGCAVCCGGDPEDALRAAVQLGEIAAAEGLGVHMGINLGPVRVAPDPGPDGRSRILGDGTPKIGAHGKPVLFAHPKDFHGALVEFEQA